jgi:hypothetical protein
MFNPYKNCKCDIGLALPCGIYNEYRTKGPALQKAQNKMKDEEMVTH